MVDTVSLSDNLLLYGDNMYWLPRIASESVDLIYLDPPFNSNRNYNVLFKDEKGSDSQAQIMAFEDTWHWGPAADDTYKDLVRNAPVNVSRMISSLQEFIGTNQMMAYLVMMTQRLLELHQVLKRTGSLYLHCDPTASHYLKVVLDTIFGPENFRNEIIWRRTNAHNKTTYQYGPIHDTILFYSKTNTFTFHPGVRPYTKAYIGDRFKYRDENGIYQTNYLTGPETRNGESGEPWRGFNPTKAGRHWAIPRSLRPFLPNEGAGMSSHEQLEALFVQGLIIFPKKAGGQPMYKQYLGTGVPYQDIWAYQPNTHGVLFDSNECIDEDVKYLEDDPERLGYDTQKPIGLLERIIFTSSNEGEIVLDPFCGCGTAIAAAHKLGRRWVGIDITHLSIALLKYRLEAMFPSIKFKVDGEPPDIGAARKLAQDDRYQFQFWACSLVRAKPLGGEIGGRTGKKGSDKGIDGVIDFIDDASLKRKQVLVQVKSGHVKSGDIRDLLGTIVREKAEIGVFITLEKPTKDMLDEAFKAGYYESRWGRHPRLQIFTIEELIDRNHPKKIDMPPQEQVSVTFKRPARAHVQSATAQLSLLDTSTVSDSVAVATLEAEEEELDDDLEEE